MLKINRLILHNFMCVKDADLDFSDNKLILLTGTNGSGKSSVLSAIALCLLEVKRSDSYKENIMLGENFASIGMEAEVNRKTLSIKITLSSKSSTMNRVAVYDDKTYTNSEVTSLLDSFDLKYYADIIMSSQGTGDITRLTPAQREEYLRKLLNFDFSEQSGECKSKLRELNEKISFNRNQIDFSKKMVLQRYNEMKTPERLDFTEDDILLREKRVSEKKKKLESLSQELSYQNSLIQRREKILSSISLAKQELMKIDTSIEYSRNSIAQKEILIQERNSLHEEYASLSSSFNEKKNSLAQMDLQISDISSKKDSLLRESSILSSEKAHGQKHLNLISQGQCPECGHEFDSSDKEKYQREYDECEKKFMDVSLHLQEVKDLLSHLQQERMKGGQDFSSISSNLSSLQMKISQMDKQISLIENEEGFLEEKEKAKGEKEEYLKSLEGQLSSLEKEITDTSSLSSQYTSISNEISSLQQEISEMNSKKSHRDFILKNNQEISKAINEMNQTIELSQNLVDEYSGQLSIYEDAQKIFEKLLPSYLILKTCSLLEEDMNNFINIVFPEMGVYLFQSKKGVEFFYTTDKNSLPKRFEKTDLINVKMSSGFEKAVISIAFKVCLCKAYGLSFAFMDEIDEAGTDENSEFLFRSILSNDLFEQLFIISHKPLVRDVIQNLATRSVTYYVNHGRFSLDE